VCPHCDTQKTPYITKAGYKCSDNKCYKKFTALTGTVFSNSKLPLRTWFYFIYQQVSHQKNISSHQQSKDFGISQATMWHVQHKIRNCLVMVKVLKTKKPQKVVAYRMGFVSYRLPSFRLTTISNVVRNNDV